MISTTISSITGLSAEKKGNFDHIFYYDGGTGTSSLSVPSDSLVYNVYTNNTKCTQRIKAVGIGIKTASGKGVNYKYQVYKNPDPDNDEMGTPLLSDYQYGVNYFSGYHTDELKEDVIIYPGEKFAVAYSFSEKVSVYIDKESNSASWYGVKVGEKQDSKYSYYMYMDLSSKYDSPVTLRIKAYSVDVKSEKIGEKV